LVKSFLFTKKNRQNTVLFNAVGRFLVYASKLSFPEIVYKVFSEEDDSFAISLLFCCFCCFFSIACHSL